MIRKIRTLIVAVAALSALGAIASQSAMAGETYHCPELAAGATCYVTVEQESNQVFTTGGGSVTCKKLHGHGEQVTPSHELTFEPTYSECTAFGFATTHVTNNGCHYTFTTPTDTANPAVHTLHSPHVVATPLKTCSIVITPTAFGASVCTQTVGAQTPTSGHLIATNITEPVTTNNYVTAEATVEGIHYIGTGGQCGANGVTGVDGKYTGNSRVTCFSDAARTVRTECTIL